MKDTTKEIIIGVLLIGSLLAIGLYASSHPSTLGQQIGSNLVQLKANMGAN